MKTYYFGCDGSPGHYLIGRPETRGWPANKCIPWGYELDTGLCPVTPGYQRQGQAALHHKAGWTALSWWDRASGDTRMGCNSTVIVEGEHDFEQMVILVGEHWPKVAERQPVELFL